MTTESTSKNNRRGSYKHTAKKVHRTYELLTSPTPSAFILENAKTSFPRRVRDKKTGEYVRGTTRGRNPIQYTEFETENHFTTRDNTTLKKNIRFVRMWFQYLKLCLEVEEKKLTIKPNEPLFKVDRNYYKKWHLDEVIKSSFNDWFPSHKHLFTLKPIELIDDIQEIPKDSFLLSIPKSATMSAAKKELERLLTDRLAANEETEFHFSNSRTPYMSLHQEYNMLVMAFNRNPREMIMNIMNDRYSHLPEARMKKPREVYKKKVDIAVLENLFSQTQAVSRRINQFGVERMRDVCDGVFP